MNRRGKLFLNAMAHIDLAIAELRATTNIRQSIAVESWITELDEVNQAIAENDDTLPDSRGGICPLHDFQTSILVTGDWARESSPRFAAPPRLNGGAGDSSNLNTKVSSMRDPFTNRPPAQERRVKVPILRSNKKCLKHSGRVLSDRVICCPTHFTTRTFVCDSFLGKNCPICEKGTLPRWIGYVAVWHVHQQKKYLMELTHSAAEKLAATAESVGSIRGWLIQIDRAGNRPNGELVVRTAAGDPNDETLPQSFDVKEQLRRMWGLDVEKPQVIITTADDPRLDFDRDTFKVHGESEVA